MTRSSSLIQPGATLGIFGGGQLGAMFLAAAHRMGYRTIVFCPQIDAPAAKLAHRAIIADYDDVPAVETFTKACEAVTTEFENVPSEALAHAAQHTLVRPSAHVLSIASHRLEERAFLKTHHFPTSAHRPAATAQEAVEAARQIGLPMVLKTATTGYDGKGQARITDLSQIPDAWQSLKASKVLCEAWVPYERELSVLVARNDSGQTQSFGPIENCHSHHILDLSIVPANLDPSVCQAARQLAIDIAHALNLEGLICVEMFLMPDGGILVNELAPRPHNSGHLTIEACHVSQFEQQVRALAGLPLAPMKLRCPAAMVNLLGDLWQSAAPQWHSVLQTTGAALHLYGKSQPRPGRKMGHITVVANTAEQARNRALTARHSLRPATTQPPAAAQNQSDHAPTPK